MGNLLTSLVISFALITIASPSFGGDGHDDKKWDRDKKEKHHGILEAGPDVPCYDNFNRYVDCENGTITDSVTGLVWTKNAGCIPPQNYTSANAAAAALGHDSCGLTDNSRPGDWRLPTQAEWKATIEEAVNIGCTLGLNGGPSLTDTTGTVCFNAGPQPFVNVDLANTALYWSSTSVSSNPANAYAWNTNGNVTANGPKTLLIQGWAVRSGR